MIAELQPSLTQYERPMYHMKEKINMLSSTDNNFMICLYSILRDLVLNLGFLFFTHTVYSTKYKQCIKSWKIGH